MYKTEDNTTPISMIHITTASANDIPLIHKLAGDIWPPAFADILSPAQITYMMNMMYSYDALRQQFREGHTFLLLFYNNQPSGYASFSHKEDPGIYKLHKIYLTDKLQGKGIGRKLMEEVTGRVKQLGAHILELNVNRYNKAISFYEKLGFSVYKTVDNPIGEGYFMNDFIMRKSI